MRVFSFLLILVLGEVRLALAQPGQWLARAPMPTPRQETTPAVLNGRIYLPGGFNASAQAVTTVEAYDPATNTWSTPPPLPEILHHYGLATVGGRMYLLGGYTGNSFTPTNRAYVFIPDSNLWRRIANMPVARGAHAAVEFGGRIYLFGGITNIGDSRRTDMYNPLTDTYTNLAQMPTAREHLAAARIDSLIYVVGGRIGATNNNVLEAYSPVSNRWYTKAPMPTARGGLAASALYGRLYVCGGEIPGVYAQNEEYNPATNSWRTMRPMLTPRHGTGAVTVGDSVYVIGGATLQGFGVSGVNELFTISEPRMSLSARLLDFGTLAISHCRNDSVKVRNVGNATLLISSILSTNPRFYPTPTSAALSAGESLWVHVRYCADFPVGVQTGDVLFSHNGSLVPDTMQLRAQNTVTAVEGENDTPRSFSLLQNYPNPFNPSTRIEYNLPLVGKRHAVSLRVFDVLGREVATLVNEEQEGGDYRVEFDAEGLPSGLYFYRLQSGGFLSTRKMLFLK